MGAGYRDHGHVSMVISSHAWLWQGPLGRGVRLLVVREIHDTTEAKLRWLEELSGEALHSASETHVERQRERGKLLARERLEKLLDPGSFVELDRFVRHREV